MPNIRASSQFIRNHFCAWWRVPTIILSNSLLATCKRSRRFRSVGLSRFNNVGPPALSENISLLDSICILMKFLWLLMLPCDNYLLCFERIIVRKDNLNARRMRRRGCLHSYWFACETYYEILIHLLFHNIMLIMLRHFNVISASNISLNN